MGSVNPFDKKDYLAWAKQNEEDSLINEGVYGDRPGWQITKDAEMLNKLEKLGVKSYGDINRLTQSDFETLMPDWQKNPGGEGGEGGGLPYIWPYQTASAPIEEEEIVVADSGLGSGHFRVPKHLRLPAARGGVMDIEDRESIIKTPDEEIVTNQMEEIEGQTAGPQWYQDRLEHLMFLGYSYEEAGDIAYDSDAYFEAIGHDPYATGGRVGRAFGGVMDTYTGRRKYGLGSIFKKATKPIKKFLKVR